MLTAYLFASQVFAVVGAFALGATRGSLWRGRLVSGSLIRLLGFARTVSLRVGLVLFLVVGWVVVTTIPYTVVLNAFAFWALDDWLNREDDDERRLEWGRVRLRMPKPVFLRPVERWAPGRA